MLPVAVVAVVVDELMAFDELDDEFVDEFDTVVVSYMIHNGNAIGGHYNKKDNHRFLDYTKLTQLHFDKSTKGEYFETVIYQTLLACHLNRYHPVLIAFVSSIFDL